jgi:hypothetical protein
VLHWRPVPVLASEQARLRVQVQAQERLQEREPVFQLALAA